MEQQCFGHVRCLSDLATWPLVMQAIMFQADRSFCLIFVTGFVIECVVTFNMELIKEQSICVKFCFKVGKTCRNPQHVAWSLQQGRMRGALVSESSVAVFSIIKALCYELPPEGYTVNQNFYRAVLRRLWEAVQKQWSEMWTAGSWLLGHDHVLLHSVINWTVLGKTWKCYPSAASLFTWPLPFRLFSIL
jgi:hypothetical protein